MPAWFSQFCSVVSLDTIPIVCFVFFFRQTLRDGRVMCDWFQPRSWILDDWRSLPWGNLIGETCRISKSFDHQKGQNKTAKYDSTKYGKNTMWNCSTNPLSAFIGWKVGGVKRQFPWMLSGNGSWFAGGPESHSIKWITIRLGKENWKIEKMAFLPMDRT